MQELKLSPSKRSPVIGRVPSARQSPRLLPYDPVARARHRSITPSRLRASEIRETEANHKSGDLENIKKAIANLFNEVKKQSDGYAGTLTNIDQKLDELHDEVLQGELAANLGHVETAIQTIEADVDHLYGMVRKLYKHAGLNTDHSNHQSDTSSSSGRETTVAELDDEEPSDVWRAVSRNGIMPIKITNEPEVQGTFFAVWAGLRVGVFPQADQPKVQYYTLGRAGSKQKKFSHFSDAAFYFNRRIYFGEVEVLELKPGEQFNPIFEVGA